jgi:phenylacetate-CoA ligase
MPTPSLVVQTLGKLGFYPTKNISPFDEPREKLAQMLAFNPQTMFVLPSSASILAQELDKGGYDALRLRLIFTGGEMLDAVTRTQVQDAFDAPVFHNYGATEVYRIYSECRDHAYHIQSDLNLVEVTENGDPVATGEEGEITITNLDKYAMPFLRYNIEDIGYLLADQCTCGCHFPLMNLTTGRKKDVIALHDGSTIPAHRLNTIVQHHMATLKQYQIIQAKRGHLRLNLVPGPGFTETVITDIYSAVNQQVGETLALQIERVEHIPREASGKYRLFKSTLNLS